MLDGVAAVLFDEFHERSLDADLGLALARDAQQGLREDLRLLVMSATIDAARIAGLLGGAPVIESEGRAFPVETRYVGRDPRPIEPQMADTIIRAMRADAGSLLAFLPGAAEIRRTQTQLENRVEASTDVVALYGALGGEEQDRAIAPAPPGRRKIVLATSIAETSITIEGVRIVVDCGLARVPRYEPDVGVTRLETVRVSRAAADQRRGRAGRTEPGVCYRLWDEPQTAALEPYARPEILAADLSSFALDLAAWGSGPEQLAFLDPPPRPALTEAKALLAALGAIDADGRITDEGRHLRRLPLPPRLARMVVDAAREGAALVAAEIAAIIGERGLGGDDVDLRARLDALHRDRSRRGRDARAMAERWAEIATSGSSRSHKREGELSVGTLIALAYPERIAKNRGGANFDSRSAHFCWRTAAARPSMPPLRWRANRFSPWPNLPAAPRPAASSPPRRSRLPRSRRALPSASKRAMRSHSTRRAGTCAHGKSAASAQSRFRTSKCGSSRTKPRQSSSPTISRAPASIGLPWSKAQTQWRDRVMFLRASEGDAWPDLSDAALAGTANEWLAPILLSKTGIDQITVDEFDTALRALLPWPLPRRLDAEAPTHFEAPTGSRVPIDYAAEGGPKISIRVQELFGLKSHPTIAGGKIPLVIELLSPAHRPVQTTRDLPGFWRGCLRRRARRDARPLSEDIRGPTIRSRPVRLGGRSPGRARSLQNETFYSDSEYVRIKVARRSAVPIVVGYF